MMWKAKGSSLSQLGGACRSHPQVDNYWVGFGSGGIGWVVEVAVAETMKEWRYLKGDNQMSDLMCKVKRGIFNPTTFTLLLTANREDQEKFSFSAINQMLLEEQNLASIGYLRGVIHRGLVYIVETLISLDFVIQFSASSHVLVTSGDLILFDRVLGNSVLGGQVRCGSTVLGNRGVRLQPRTIAVPDPNSKLITLESFEGSPGRDDRRHSRGLLGRFPSFNFVEQARHTFVSRLIIELSYSELQFASSFHQWIYGGCEFQACKDLQSPRIVTIGSHNLKTGLRMQIMPELLQKDFVLKMESRPIFVMFSNGTLSLTNKALAKLIIGYRRDGRVGELSKLLLSIQKELGLSEEASLSSDFIDACIQLGWLETAHDILDDMESANTPVGSITYRLLLIAYCKGNMFREAKALLKQMRKVGLLVNLSDQKVISTCLEEVDINPIHTKGASSIGKSALAESLIREMKEEEKEMSSLVYEIDSSIYFFCKAKMMEDALETYRRMQGRKVQPTVQTFTSLVNGYSSLEMYREITILWGEIKRRIDCGDLIADRNLYEVLLWNFIRGGYFERVMEVIGYMKKKGMYTDKWKYKSEFLKFHKNLYKSLKASNAKTEAQSKRLEHVRAFRKWVGID
ncbi:hypothetical protein HHK36_000446 [Tetracentron sinense]|uniref:Pentatricopeptide repeat-containing protein n=1 Tax=Tetracentron sinense TaxID=13715 RepID=A0A834ZU39_TETSI|nr:hypothetical protein HHK36_000446 [Tetracentron sinense]